MPAGSVVGSIVSHQLQSAWCSLKKASMKFVQFVVSVSCISLIKRQIITINI